MKENKVSVKNRIVPICISQNILIEFEISYRSKIRWDCSIIGFVKHVVAIYSLILIFGSPVILKRELQPNLGRWKETQNGIILGKGP